MSETIVANEASRKLVPGWGGRIAAALVYDGTDEVRIPAAMGEPAPGQMIGTARERLVELAGRCCYDSLGRGRSSAEYAKHLIEVGHLSVLEHAAVTVAFRCRDLNEAVWLESFFLNRPSAWLRLKILPTKAEGFEVRATLNLRHVMEWDKANRGQPGILPREKIGKILRKLACPLAPGILGEPPAESMDYLLSVGGELAAELGHGVVESAAIVEPETDEEKWVTFYTTASRGCGEEMIRHGDWTAFSRRCLSGDTVVAFVNAKNQAAKARGYRTLEWLYERRQNPRLWSVVKKRRVRVFDEKNGGFTFARMHDVVSSGVKECFRVTLANGRSITCTADHRILTERGWATLREVASPERTTGGLISWQKETAPKIACNGTRVAGLGFYRDSEWLRRRYLQDGASAAVLAVESQVRVATIRRALCDNGIKRRVMGDFSKSPVSSKDWLHEQYVVLRKKQEEIAQLAECSVAAVHNYVKKFGLQAPERSGFQKGLVPWNHGKTYTHTKPYSAETIEKYRQSKLGPRNPGWKGGKGTAARRAFQVWKRYHKREVFERDGWRCRLCEKLGSEIQPNGKHFRKRTLEIHHILPLWNRPDLACEMGNMATVCWRCQLKVNNHELEFAPRLLEAIRSPVPYMPSDRKRVQGRRRVIPHFVKIERIEWAGVIPTFDLVLEGPNHGFVGNGIVVHNSTRYVDESESEWVLHPLLGQAWADAPKRGGLAVPVAGALRGFAEKVRIALAFDEPSTKKLALDELVAEIRDYASFWEGPLAAGMVAQEARVLYHEVVRKLQMHLEARGIDKTSARKQARGAARGFLGLALESETIVSFSVAQGLHMLDMRAADASDAEIRLQFAEAFLPGLRASRYGGSFAHLELVAASDGIGRSLRGGGHK